MHGAPPRSLVETGCAAETDASNRDNFEVANLERESRISMAKSDASEIADKCLQLALKADAKNFDTIALLLRMAALAAAEIQEPAQVSGDPVPASPLIGLWDLDVATGRVVSDKVFAEFYGVDVRAAQAGAPLEDYVAAIHPLDRPRVSAAIEKAIATGDDFVEEYRVRRRDGSVSWVIARGKCWHDDAGRPLHFPGAVVDISNLRRIRAA